MSQGEPHDLQRTYLRRLGRLKSLSGAFGARHDAEDVLQEIWLRIGGMIPRDIRHPDAYLTRMVANAVNSCLRRDGRQEALRQEVAAIMAGDAAVSTERIVAGRQAVAAVEAALAALPDRTREVFLLSRVEGHTHRSIAAQLGISEQTVHYHIRRTVDHLAPLRDAIYDKDIGSDD